MLDNDDLRSTNVSDVDEKIPTNERDNPKFPLYVKVLLQTPTEDTNKEPMKIL